MSSYFIAQIKINNEDTYKKYLKDASLIFSKYNGKYLAVDNDPEILEGKWNYTRIVLIEFPNKNELKKWYNSKDYQKILKYRLNAAQCDTIIANSKS
mgnify:CR=1 FL=1